jgi:phosphoribosyl 1,2-cyclic phosphate phosphodiesterase
MEVQILGCGATFGVPIVGGNWGKCDPSNPKNMRTRPCIAIKQTNQSIIIDAGPDFRLQTAKAGIAPDVILITHGHWDHIAGLGELTYYVEETLKRDLHIYADSVGLKFIRGMFSYLFDDEDVIDGCLFTAAGDEDEYKIIWHQLEPYVPLIIGEAEIMPFLQNHGNIDSIGYRIGNFSYSTDVKDFPEQSQKFLENLHTWILDCDYWDASESHGDPEGVLRLAARFKPERVYLTHMDEKMDYATLINWFESRGHRNIAPGYDGLKFNLPVGDR